jgi:hypothetical protein
MADKSVRGPDRPAEDDELLRELVALIRRVDPVPETVLEAARAVPGATDR